MNWEKLYEKLESLKDSNGSKLFGEPTIKKIKALNEHNRLLYLEYHNYYINHKSQSSYKQYRSKILDILSYPSVNNKKLQDINIEILDEYFGNINEKCSTFNSRCEYIKDFFEFHKDKVNVELSYFNELKLTKADIEDDIDNAHVALTSEEVELYRDKYSTNPLKLFVFEMIYYTGISLKDLRKLNYNNFDFENSQFKLSSKNKLKVPEFIGELVKALEDDEYFNSNKDYIYLLKEVAKELHQSNIIENLKYADIAKTLNTKTAIQCPECGEKKEATIDNWCAKQYYIEGRIWIVCKDCGGLNE